MDAGTGCIPAGEPKIDRTSVAAGGTFRCFRRVDQFLLDLFFTSGTSRRLRSLLASSTGGVDSPAVAAMRLFVPCLLIASLVLLSEVTADDSSLSAGLDLEKRELFSQEGFEDRDVKKREAFRPVEGNPEVPLLEGEVDKPISRAKRGDVKQAAKKGAKIALWLLLVIIIVPSLLCLCCVAGVTYFFCCRE
uniref:Transmembrane protein n=1 Tax=Steinernema glaseri TaxID=37863 RepID=A0A1I7ZX62_9BILA